MSTIDRDARLQRLVERQDRLDERKALVRRQQEVARSTTAATRIRERSPQPAVPATAVSETDLARAFESVGLRADAAAVAARGRHYQPQTLAEAGSLLGLDAQRAQTFAKGRS